jgi:hypothetical protein
MVKMHGVIKYLDFKPGWIIIAPLSMCRVGSNFKQTTQNQIGSPNSDLKKNPSLVLTYNLTHLSSRTWFRTYFWNLNLFEPVPFYEPQINCVPTYIKLITWRITSRIFGIPS